jgi:hypothetical protein
MRRTIGRRSIIPPDITTFAESPFRFVDGSMSGAR